MVNKILMTVGGLILLAGGGAGGYYVQEFRASLEAGEESEEKEPEFEIPEPIPEEYPAAMLSLDPFLTNVSDPGADRFAKVQIQLAIVECTPKLRQMKVGQFSVNGKGVPDEREKR